MVLNGSGCEKQLMPIKTADTAKMQTTIGLCLTTIDSYVCDPVDSKPIQK